MEGIAVVRGMLAIMLALGTFCLPVKAQRVSLKIPPVKTSVEIENQPVTITTSGNITQVRAPRGQNVFQLELLADLSDLQHSITMILRTALNREDRCGDHIDIQHATLSPQEPASVVVSQLHFERWKCVKMFGRERPNKLIGGNGVIEVKLTPAVDQGTTLRLVPTVGRIEAEGALGELLRSGSLGEQLREKVRDSLLHAMQKRTDFKATLPPVVQDYVVLESAQFNDAGGGDQDVDLQGRFQVSDEQIRELTNQVKQRLASAQSSAQP